MTRAENPPAFPHPGGSSDSTVQTSHIGMTLRDYFAAKAMHAEALSAGSFEGPAMTLVAAAKAAGQSIEQRIAFNAYVLADAMLAARQGGGQERRRDMGARQ